jgi:hypothetical protein
MTVFLRFSRSFDFAVTLRETPAAASRVLPAADLR